MAWPRFFLFNTAGAILWATVYGLGAYYLGDSLKHPTRPAAIALATVGVMAIFATLHYLRHSQNSRLRHNAPFQEGQKSGGGRAGLPAEKQSEDHRVAGCEGASPDRSAFL